MFLGDRLISCASFRRTDRGESWEIARFATDYEFTVHGGFQKIMKQIKDLKPLISYSHNRLGSGAVYEKAGFKDCTKAESSGYWYTDLNTKKNRRSFIRDNDPDILAKYPTEQDQALAGILSGPFGHSKPIYKIYDYGSKKWILE